MVFFGEYEVSFSGQGRIILPKKIRALLNGAEFVITRGSDNCLAGYDKNNWNSRTDELLKTSVLEDESAKKRRFIFSSMVYLEIDAQGRFVIPRNLLEYAGLKEKAIIIGTGDHFEIWNPEKWTNYMNKN